MATRLRIVLSCLLVASLAGCSSGSQATSPPDAPTVAGGIVGSAGTGGGPGGVGGGGGTGGQLSTATSATPPLCIPGASVACACVTGQTGAQTCTAAGVLGACVCAASTVSPDASAPAACVPGASVACACPTGQQGAQICTSVGTFGACVCSAPAVDAGGGGGSDGAVTNPPDASVVGGAGASGGTSTGGLGGGSGGNTASSSTFPVCTSDTANLVTGNTLICDTGFDIQGSFYAFGDGSSCTTSSPLACSATAGCCMSGTTVVDPFLKKWGCGLGMELNDTGGDTPVKSVYNGPAKCFDITLAGSSGGNEVRIGFTQSTATAGKVSPFVSVAAFTSGWSGRVCFTDAECPDLAVTAGTCSKAVGTAGTPYDLQIQISAGSTTTSVGAFNVCVTKIAPMMDPGSVGTTNSCSTVTGQGTLSGQYDTAHVTCAGQDYIVQNNAWGSTAGQTLSYGPGTKFKVTVQNGTGANNAPASYPDIFIGANASKSTTGSGLPKAVSALGSVQTSWTWSDSGVSGTYNATYDVWFSTSSAGDPATATIPSAAYLMVWLYTPTGAQPNGSMTSSATIAGNNWNLWVGTSNGKPCYSYVALNKLNSASFDLNLFIKDAVTRGYVQNSWSLTNVFSGFEIWSGGVGLQTTDFAVTVK